MHSKHSLLEWGISEMTIYCKQAGHAVKRRDVDFEIKAVEKDGFFSGYGSVFGVVDSYKEIVLPGAFADSIAERAAKNRKLPVLWQHRSAEPLGVYEVVKEDKAGLYLEGRLLVDDVVQAREAHALMKVGAVTGLSIGYYVREDSWDEKERIRSLKKLDLQETSIVTFPANDEARVDAVKSLLAGGNLPSLSDFEDFLREAGFSKSQATAVASRGLKHLHDRSDSGQSHLGDAHQAVILAALKSAQFTQH